MKDYNIAISASISYAPYAKVMIASFLKKHPDSKVNFYIFYLNDEVLDLKSDFEKILNNYNQFNKVDFIRVNDNKLKSVDTTQGWALDLWCRWYLFDYLVEFCDRVLVIGVDTMFQQNIDDYYFQNLDGYYFSSSSDMFINNTGHESWPRIKADMDRMGLNDKSKYINGDVVLVNLKETKGNIDFESFLKLYADNHFVCWDQDVINYCFNDRIKHQDYLKYNYFPNLGIDSIDDNNLYKNAKIIHFAGGPKPWYVPICRSKKFNAIPEWWKYAIEVNVAKKFPYIHCYISLTYWFLRNKFTCN
jgi:lipopolysaccharide biosynthesis glycosyltransferase